ncbi:MAG: hypothetical protein ACOX6T_17455 [Myxococcales bacterium]|jgi:hypothetical protein
MRSLVILLLLALPGSVLAQASTATPVPQKHIPAPVLMELRALENQFDLALLRNCAPERCASKGCVYRDHVVVDLPRSTSLPGLGQTEGLGSVPPQEYLTAARCDFAHEKSVSARDIQGLIKRLEQLLSKGWLRVDVGHQVLAPVSPELSESPPPKPETPPEPVEPPEPPPAPQPPQEWDAKVALRELWLELLPHFAWMIALLLGTLAALTLIWAVRRVGKESAEEKALLAQLAAGNLSKDEPQAEAKPQEPPPAEPAEAPEPPGPKLPSPEELEEAATLAEQRRLWTERMSQAELANDEGGIVELLRGWLRNREFPLLAKALFVLGERVSLAFPSDGTLAEQKVEFAEYLRRLDDRKLPSDADFFRTLNQHAISSTLLSQPDAEIFLSLREEFGTVGLANLIERLPARFGALLFAMVPADARNEVARALAPELHVELAEQLLRSNRISQEEQEALFSALDSARSGLPLPQLFEPSDHQIVDRGREFDAPGALSMLLPQLDPEDRGELLTRALQRSSGVLPGWYEQILFPDMLLKVPKDLRVDLLLEVDVRALAGWSSLQPADWQESFLAQLAPTMQNAVRANQAFGSRADQLRYAQRGQQELVAALQKLAAQGKVSFREMLV